MREGTQERLGISPWHCLVESESQVSGGDEVEQEWDPSTCLLQSGADVRSTWLQRQPTGNLASLNSDVLFLGSVQLDRIKNAIRAGGSPALFRGKLQRTSFSKMHDGNRTKSAV
ncbi:hypothetical protein BO79DRAFT_222750 [Aspergillus costaricaensis CBS 115574]|uniref:Uncharacterized protein n=1 Tax=Aspergillus costaricaensis CBS 115574 TaxID=1448317 RepID=A0ACD1HZ34_9EURO|nr:hypothetical protein BO79DRAFT_222750 [Aspergillus costaricaensis CBS 115574]RAK83271.1 hypothetical protein BO79DRAFT_222750 [Aspergillus costaricaensis CBS 115574]